MSVVAIRPDGSPALEVGATREPTYPRSSNKPLQVVGMLDAGWQPASTQQIAIAAASHSGEPRHLAVVRRVLGGLPADALDCPAALPLDEAAAHALLAGGGGPSRLHMNCSGKHAAMLATCQAAGWPLSGYLAVDHPLQLMILAAIEDVAGEPVTQIAVDGCGAPQHALTLLGLARAFSALVTAEPGSSRRRAADAVRAHPDLVGGTGRDVTRLMQGMPGLLAKDGAEGVYAAARSDGSAVALKVEDGAARARMPVLVAGLRALGAEGDVMDEMAELPVFGGDQKVGFTRLIAT